MGQLRNLGLTLGRNPGRVAGLWYLLLVLLGPIRLIYIPNKLFVSDDAPGTVANILMHDRLFRLGIASDLVAAIVLVMLTLAFYRMFEGIDPELAVMVVIFGGIMPALFYFLGVVSDLGTLLIVHGPGFLSVFSTSQQDALAMLLLKLHSLEETAAETFWGLWLLPLAALVYRSGFLPRFLGVWLVLGGIAYLALSFVGVLWPQYQGYLFAITQPALLSEVALMLWLLIKGVHKLDPCERMMNT